MEKNIRFMSEQEKSYSDTYVDSSGYFYCSKGCGRKTNNCKGVCSACGKRKCIYPGCEKEFTPSARANYVVCGNHRTKYILENIINGKFVGVVGIRREKFFVLLWFYLAMTQTAGWGQ